MMLKVRPDIHQSETLMAYCLRLADGNGLNRVPSIFFQQRDDLDAPISCQRNNLSISTIARLTGRSVNTLAAHAIHGAADTVEFKGNRFSRRHFVVERRKLCPVCAGETLIYPWHWSIRLMVSCPKHRCLLIDTCTRCGQRLTWWRGHSRCTCGAKLAEFDLTEATREQFHVAQILAANYTNFEGANLAEWQAKLSVPELERVALTWNHYRRDLPAGIERDRHHAQCVGQVLASWPDGYFAKLDELKCAVGGQAGEDESVVRALDRHTRLGTRWLRTAAPMQLRERFAEWLAGASRMADFEFARAALPNLLRYVNVPISSLCRDIGITRIQFAVLVRGGLLDYRPLSGEKYVDVRSLAAIIADLTRDGIPARNDLNAIALATISPGCSRHYCSSFLRTVEAILAGECPVYVFDNPAEPLFRRIRVSLDDLERLGIAWAHLRNRRSSRATH